MQERRIRRLPRLFGAVGATAVCVSLVGLGASASSPPFSNGQPKVAASVSERETAGPGALPDIPSEGVTATARSVQPGLVPDPLGAKPAVAQPAATGTPPAAPLADLRRSSAAFEAAAGKASAPGPRPAPDPDLHPPMPDFTGVARGTALGELQGRFDEFAHNQWMQTGSVSFSGTERVETVKVGGIPTHRYSVCVDSSAIEIRDAAGAVVLPAAPAGTRKALNTYDIQQQKGTWVVVDHSFPNSASC